MVEIAAPARHQSIILCLPVVCVAGCLLLCHRGIHSGPGFRVCDRLDGPQPAGQPLHGSVQPLLTGLGLVVAAVPQPLQLCLAGETS